MPEEFFEITGIEEVCEMLERAPKEIVPGALLKALKAGGDVIESALVTKTPVRAIRSGGDEEYPALIDDLGTVITLDSDFRGGVAQVGFGKQGYVARFVEYGHQMVAHGATRADRDNKYEGKLLGEGVPPKPFMRPAADASQEAAVEAFTETLMDELAKGKIIDAA